MRSALRKVFAVLFLVESLFWWSCSSGDKQTDSAESTFKFAQELEQEDLFERAIQKYNEVKNKYPYSKFATLAELAVADVHYKDEAYPEAQVSYQTFKELHPKHAKIDYVTFRLAMSYFKQLPGTFDRDLTLANSAILFFDEVMSKYPNSEFVKEAADDRRECFKMLALKELYIADFYFKQELFDSALTRYEFMLKKYAQYGYEARGLAQAKISAHFVGDSDKEGKYLRELQSKFPDSRELKSAEKNAGLLGDSVSLKEDKK